MSKKTNAAKRQRPRKHYRKPRNSKHPNPAFKTGLSNASLIECAETLAFGTVGCQILRALGIKPFTLLAVPDNSKDDNQEAEA